MSVLLRTIRREASRAKPHIDSLLNHNLPLITMIPNRTKYYNNRHRDPRYRLERTRKVWPVYLPDFDTNRDSSKLAPDEIRSKMKEKGLAPPRPWREREMFIGCTMGVIDPPTEPASDGKSSSLVSKVKLPIEKFVKSKRALSVIRTYEGDDFELDDFKKAAIEIYIKAHEALVAKNEREMFDYVTEHCFPMMTNGINNHTIIWKYLGEVEAPVVDRIRVAEYVSKNNKFAQITMKFHTKQILSVYDRHGRLVYGSPSDVKEVYELVVFERHLGNEYGNWRMHERVKPASEQQAVSKTFAIA